MNIVSSAFAQYVAQIQKHPLTAQLCLIDACGAPAFQPGEKIRKNLDASAAKDDDREDFELNMDYSYALDLP